MTQGSTSTNHMGTGSGERHPNPKFPHLFQYRPLQTLDSIRMLKLLPGEVDEAVRITLHHRDLSQMPTCVAISYEWGEITGQNEVFCDGRILRVTTNLLALLKELRRSHEMRPLWIDAICINQENLEERSQQVTLMGDIYRNAVVVLVWLGKDNQFTEEAFQIIPLLADELVSLTSESELFDGFQRMGQFEDPLQTRHGAHLAAMAGQLSWAGITDIFSLRTYFLRLWIFQEILLPQKAIVVCGRHRISWESFTGAARLIWHCRFLQKGMNSFSILRNIYTLAKTQRDIREYGTSLWLLVAAFSEAQASDPRDRIFGLLGMLDEGPQKDFICVDYRRSTEQVYQEATECIIVYEQYLGLWNYLNLGPDVKGGVGLPSWVPWFGDQAILFGIRQLDLIDQVCKTHQPMQVQRKILKVYGLIFDLIIHISDNLCVTNIKSCIRQAFNSTTTSPFPSIGQNEAITSLWQALVAFDVSLHDYSMCEKGFLSLNSQEANISEDLSTEEQDYFELQMKLDLWDEDLGLGRNLFGSSQGYFGVGPAGRNGPAEAMTPVVQVGDFIALIANARTPVILRPTDGGHYSLIGAAYIGCIQNSPRFQDRSPLELSPILII